MKIAIDDKNGPIEYLNSEKVTLSKFSFSNRQPKVSPK
jgi:hypothetical protein